MRFPLKEILPHLSLVQAHTMVSATVRGAIVLSGSCRRPLGHQLAPLETLLFALMEEVPDTRTLKPGIRPDREWITVQLEVDIQQ
jgi:hypothetical protein